MTTRKITEDDLTHAATLMASGASLSEASSAIGRTADVVSQLLRIRGVMIPRTRRAATNGRTDLPETLIVEQYQAGVSELALSKAHGASRQAIQNLLRRHNVQRRGGSESMLIRMAQTSPEQRRELVAKARAKRFDNMAVAAYSDDINNPAVGLGEREIANALESLGHPVARQEMFEGYCIDIGIGTIAVEVKAIATMAFTADPNRTEYLVERGKHVIFIVINEAGCVQGTNLDQIIALIDGACRNPAPVGEYWVIKCRRKTETTGRQSYDLSLVRYLPEVC